MFLTIVKDFLCTFKKDYKEKKFLWGVPLIVILSNILMMISLYKPLKVRLMTGYFGIR